MVGLNAESLRLCRIFQRMTERGIIVRDGFQRADDTGEQSDDGVDPRLFADVPLLVSEGEFEWRDGLRHDVARLPFASMFTVQPVVEPCGRLFLGETGWRVLDKRVFDDFRSDHGIPLMRLMGLEAVLLLLVPVDGFQLLLLPGMIGEFFDVLFEVFGVMFAGQHVHGVHVPDCEEQSVRVE